MSKVKKAKPTASSKAKVAPKKSVAAKKPAVSKSVKAPAKKTVASLEAKKPAATIKSKVVLKKPAVPVNSKKQEHVEVPKVRNDKPSSELLKASTEMQKQPTMTVLCKVIFSAWQQLFGKK